MFTKKIATLLLAVIVIGCGESGDPTFQSATVGPPPAGPVISFMGVLRADDTLLPASSVDAVGRSVYDRVTGSGFRLVIEAKPGTDGAAVGISTFDSDPMNPSVRPDLQVEVSNNLGDGSTAVCDDSQGNFGGVPGITPPNFDVTQPISDALNDFGCRFKDGVGNPKGISEDDEACVAYPDGEFHFVDSSTTVEFCSFISRPISFVPGDTVITARVRDTNGVTGPTQQIVIRITGS